MPSIDTRIAAIAAALERRRMEQECPEDDLSRSLREFGEELAQLDDLEKAALLAEAANCSEWLTPLSLPLAGLPSPIQLLYKREGRL